MWREGDREVYGLAMNTVLPVLKKDEAVWNDFVNEITPEFREYLFSGSGSSEND